MEEKTKCPLCEDLHNNCFVERTEVEGLPFESYMCFGCGMTTNSYMTIDSDKLEELTKNNTQLMNDLKIMDDERGLIWYPSVVNMGEKGLIYPDGVKTDWYWHYAKVIEVPEEERKEAQRKWSMTYYKKNRAVLQAKARERYRRKKQMELKDKQIKELYGE